MANNFTNEQRDAIENRGALLVSAAAGSGKTTVLVERIVQCILDPKDPCDITKMLVVTFTNAAAAEMKSRIEQRLQQELAQQPNTTRLQEQLMYLQKANISTIDAFCKTLITEHFEKLNLSPDFTILSETALALLKGEAMKETLEDMLTRYPADFGALALCLGENNGNAISRAISIVYEYLRSLPFPSLWVEQVRNSYANFTTMAHSPWGAFLIEKEAAQVTRAIITMETGLKELETEPDVNPKRYDRLSQGLEDLRHFQTALAQKDWDGVHTLCQTACPVGFSGAAMADSALKDATVALQQVHKTALESLKETFQAPSQTLEEEFRAVTPAIDFLFTCVEEFSARLAEKKKDQNALDFADVEYAALSLLVTLEQGKPTPTPLAKEIAGEFRYVMVDEYQDSNNLQNEIYKALSHGGKTLFTVGDVKQSIYRFRKANPNLFLDMLEAYPKYNGGNSPATVTLSGNFRSRGEICRTVNAFFSFVMSKEAGDIDYNEDHYLIPLNDTFPETSAKVTLDVLEKDHRTAIETEADRIAMHIKELVNTPCVTENGQLRCATYNDCVILLRSHKNKAPYYVKRLQEHGIPAVADSTDGYFEKREIRLVRALLSTINNPTDDISLLAVLLSPLFGFSAEEVARLRLLSPKGTLYGCLQAGAKEGNQKAVDFIGRLDTLRLYAVTLTPHQLLEKVYQTYHLPALVQLWERGQARKQNLLALLTLAREWEQNGITRLESFLSFLQKLEEEKQNFTPATNALGGNGVRVISVHASKGLQFPICFLAGCNGKRHNGDATEPLELNETLGVGITLHRAGTNTHTKTPARIAIQRKNKQAELGEELRILYVALTRAVDRLYFFPTCKDPVKEIEKAALSLNGGVKNHKLHWDLVLSAQNFGQLFLYFGLMHPAGNLLRVHGNTCHGYLDANQEDFEVNLLASRQIPEPATKAEPSQQPLRAVEPETLSQITNTLSYQNPFAGVEQLLAKRSVSALTKEGGGIPPIPRPAFLQEGGLTPAEKGTALHQFMQYANYQAAAENPAEEIRRMVELAFLTPLQGEAVDEEKLKAFFQSDLYRRMAASPQVLREHKFMASLPVTQIDPTLPKELEGEQVVVQGITDCLFCEEDGFVLVDYKTDKVKTPEELVARYKDQLQLYAKMLQSNSKIQVKELLLYSFCLNQEISIPL